MTKPKHTHHHETASRAPEKKEHAAEQKPTNPKPSLNDAARNFMESWNNATFHSLGIDELKPAVEQLRAALE